MRDTELDTRMDLAEKGLKGYIELVAERLQDA